MHQTITAESARLSLSIDVSLPALTTVNRFLRFLFSPSSNSLVVQYPDHLVAHTGKACLLYSIDVLVNSSKRVRPISIAWDFPKMARCDALIADWCCVSCQHWADWVSQVGESVHTDKPQGDPKNQSQRQVIQSLFSDLPPTYGARWQALLQLRDIFHQEMATCLQPSLNQYLSKQQPANSGEKDNLAAHVTHDLRMLGLAIRSPVSPDPARLSVAGVRKRGISSIKYRLESIMKGPRQSDPTFDEIPIIELRSDPMRCQTLPLTLRSSRRGGDRER